MVVHSLFYYLPLFVGVLCLVFVLLCITLCFVLVFCNHLDEEERAGRFALIVFLMSYYY